MSRSRVTIAQGRDKGMDLTQALDGYCERLGPAFWAEPWNAVTNLAFLVAALVMARRLHGQAVPLAQVLTGLLAFIGLGSFLFHTTAQVWSALADTLPIVLFALVYLFAANRAYLGLRRLPALALALLYLPLTAALTPLLSALPFVRISAMYWPLVGAFLVYAFVLRARLPQVARGLVIAGGLLTASLTFRSLDMPLCGALPMGTHFLWHCLNAVLLGWVIEVYRRHHLRSLAAPASDR